MHLLEMVDQPQGREGSHYGFPRGVVQAAVAPHQADITEHLRDRLVGDGAPALGCARQQPASDGAQIHGPLHVLPVVGVRSRVHLKSHKCHAQQHVIRSFPDKTSHWSLG